MSAAHLDARVALTRAQVATLDADALLVTHLPNVSWLTGFFSSSAALVLAPSWLCVLTDFRYQEDLSRLVASGALATDTRVQIVEGPLDAAASQLLREVGARRIAIEAEHVSMRRFSRLHALLPEAELLQAEPFIERLRARKDALEIAIYREAAARLADVAARLPALVAPGREEREVAALIDLELKRAGFERTAFETIVASGPNSARPHARPTSRRLGTGDGVVLDFGGVFKGYCVDLTRTAFIGRPTEAFLRLFAAVEDAQAAAIGAVKIGTRASAVDAAARDVLAGRGLERAFGHATGHGLGIDVHEFPRLGRLVPDGEDPLLVEGMIVTIEPGAYVANIGGVRIEDDVLVGAGGADVLTDIPRGLMAPGAR